MADNTWLKLTIKTDPLLVEPISDYLVGMLDAGVETGARDELLYGTVNGYMQQANLQPEEIGSILDQVSAYLDGMAEIFRVPKPDLSYTMIGEEDWGKSWKNHFRPFAVIPGLVIAPSWEEYQQAAGEAVITMDPGMAFGTGHHATTSLSLALIRRTLVENGGQRLLDVGTGTGILGMAAVLFGAKEVLGLDNDPEAVAAAAENVRRNSLQNHMRISLAPLSSLDQPYNIVVANIVHDVLLSMADELTRLTTDGGNLILSGILVGEQAAHIADVFTAKGFQLLQEESCREWAAQSFVRRCVSGAGRH